MAKESPWFERAFAAEYLELYRHRSPEQGRAQVRQMLAAGILPQGGNVLDLCCGAGRHLWAMREAGLDAAGLDLSMDLLDAGKLQGYAVRADARRIPFAGAQFDVVTNLFSSFGYFEEDGDQLRVLKEVRRVLKPGGRLVLDHMNARVAVRELQAETVDEREALTLVQRRRHDATRHRIIKDVEYTPKGGTPRKWQERVRVFTPAELDALMAAAGLRTRQRFADFDGLRFDENASPRQVIVAVADSA
jgi:ubiquinone/menaquinone biosynthesis C-methylase UbiE